MFNSLVALAKRKCSLTNWGFPPHFNADICRLHAGIWTDASKTGTRWSPGLSVAWVPLRHLLCWGKEKKVCTPPLNQLSNKPRVRERGRSKHHWLQTISFILSFVGEEKKNESNIHPPSSGPFWSTQLSFLSRQHLAYCESCSGNGILDEHLWSAFKFMHSKAWLCKQFHVCLEFL